MYENGECQCERKVTGVRNLVNTTDYNGLTKYVYSCVELFTHTIGVYNTISVRNSTFWQTKALCNFAFHRLFKVLKAWPILFPVNYDPGL